MRYDEDDLMHVAKANVRLKRNLMRHVIAFVIAAPLILILFEGFLDEALVSHDVMHSHNPTVTGSLSELRMMAFQFSSAGDTEASAIVAQAAADLATSIAAIEPTVYAIAYSIAAYDAAWFFAWGAYFAWGLFVLSRLIMYFRPKVRQKEQKQVSAEYARLKKGTLDVVDIRENA